MGYGYKKVTFSVPIKWIDDLDIYMNIRVQDPYGISWTKGGEQGHYYYIISLEVDYQSEIIDIIAVDLQWILSQYAVFGDRDALADRWANASEHERMYFYKCDRVTGKFSDGTPGKMFIDRNII